MYPASRITGEGRAECSWGWGVGGWWGAKEFSTALGRIDVGVCYTRGTRSRQWCGWWGRRGHEGGGGRGDELEERHVYMIIPFFYSVRSFFVSASVWDIRNQNSWSNRFVRAPSLGADPMPLALSFPFCTST